MIIEFPKSTDVSECCDNDIITFLTLYHGVSFEFKYEDGCYTSVSCSIERAQDYENPTTEETLVAYARNMFNDLYQKVRFKDLNSIAAAFMNCHYDQFAAQKQMDALA